MSSIKRTINQQCDETWAELTRRFISATFKYENMLSPDLYLFLNSKAISIGTNIGYILLPLLTTINYLMSRKNGKIEIREGYNLNLNTFAIFVGPPTTGKSSAFKAVISEPLSAFGLFQEIISSTTTSGLTKKLSETKKVLIANPEISEYLLKLFKNDDDNCNGESQLICKLFSEESSNINYATEHQRSIDENIAFSIIGATQVKFMTHILSKMDNGGGFMDRFLVFVPTSLRPLPDQQVTAKRQLEDFQKDTIFQMYAKLNDHNTNAFYLDDQALRYFVQFETEIINNFNDALLQGTPTVKSKKTDLVPRIAVAIHCLESVFACFHQNSKLNLREDIGLNTVKKAIYFVDFLENQKEIFSSFITHLNEEKIVKKVEQPSSDDIVSAMLLCP